MDTIGIDIGFGFTKATNGRDFVAFKSIFGDAAEIPYREQLLSHGQPEEHLHLELNGKPLFVGELAERHSQVRSFTLDQDQFITSFARTMALAALSRLAERNVPVNVVTGLPIAYYQRHREPLSTLLKGKHPLTVTDQKGQSTETVLAVNQVRVVPQPFGSLFDAMLNDAAEVTGVRFAREKIGIIDVGFRTADYTIADHTRYSARGSATTESGISRAFAIIAARLKDLTGVDVELYRLYDAVHAGSIKVRGKVIDLKEPTNEVFAQLASTVASEADRLWHDDWDMDVVVVTGGGGAVLAPWLRPLLAGEVLVPDASRDARQNNVRGYWKYGRHLWERAATRAKVPPSQGTS